MHPNEEAIQGFYEAFSTGDHATMAALYADDATFSDPVFPHLDANGVRAMWRMFCTGGSDIAVTYSDIRADDRTGTARWEADYRFPRTGRSVHNVIDASFEFRDGQIVKHTDRFDFYRWSRMALGPAGAALGWTPLIKGAVRKQAGAQLARFRSQEGRA